MYISKFIIYNYIKSIIFHDKSGFESKKNVELIHRKVDKNMHEFERISKEVDVANLQFEYEMSLIDVSSIFTEDGDGSVDKNFFVRLTNKVVEFIQKIVKSIKEAIQNFIVGGSCKKMRSFSIEYQKKLCAAKVSATDYAEVHKFDEETQNKIKKAKSIEEIDKIMDDYKKKRAKIRAIATTVTIGSIFAYCVAKHNAYVHELEGMMKGQRFDGNSALDKKRATADAYLTRNISGEYWKRYREYATVFYNYINNVPNDVILDDFKKNKMKLVAKHEITKEDHKRIQKMSNSDLREGIRSATREIGYTTGSLKHTLEKQKKS